MTTQLQNSDIFSNTPRPAPAIAALQDLVKRPVNPRTGLKIRRIVRTINQQIDDIMAERDRIIELHGTKNEEANVFDLSPEGQSAWGELMGLTFEVEQLEIGEIEALKEIPPATLIDLGDLLADEPSPNGNVTKAEAAAKRRERRRK